MITFPQCKQLQSRYRRRTQPKFSDARDDVQAGKKTDMQEAVPSAPFFISGLRNVEVLDRKARLQLSYSNERRPHFERLILYVSRCNISDCV